MDHPASFGEDWSRALPEEPSMSRTADLVHTYTADEWLDLPDRYESDLIE
jgi:hypothetical protein